MLYRSLGVERDEELRWPLGSLLQPSVQAGVVAYKRGAFIPIQKGTLEFQVGRGVVRLVRPPDELRVAYDLICRAARQPPRTRPHCRLHATDAHAENAWMERFKRV